MFTYIKRSYKL